MNDKSCASKKLDHPWSKDALLAKARLYSEDMLAYPHDDWHFGLTSTFVLEFVARAAVANISPTLLADGKDWNNIYFALGHSPTAPKFIPKSIDLSSVLSHLKDVLPEFTAELEGFCAKHINRRNEELHTGESPFSVLPANWLAKFYEAISILISSMEDSLVTLVGSQEAKFADKAIAAVKDESAKAVTKAITAHTTVWQSKEQTERQALSQKSTAWALRQSGHRVPCPSCANEGLVLGSPISSPIRRLESDLIVEVQDYLPEKFECIACQLKIAGLSQLTACGLNSTYKVTSTFDAADYYAPEDDQYSRFDDDNNEQ